MNNSDITLFTDAALNIDLKGFSDQGQWFKNNWNDIQLDLENNINIVWKKLVAKIHFFIHSGILSIKK